MGFFRKSGATVFLGFLLISFGSQASHAQKAVPVPQLDMNRLRGTWYEIARLPNKGEKRCVSDAYELIAFGDAKNSIQLGDSCVMKHGDSDLRSAGAKQDKQGDGKLKVKHLFIFSRPYWVLDVAQDNSWAMVGTPNHKEMWLFSKKSTLQPEVVADLKAKAAAQGYPVDKLVMTPQLAQALSQSTGAGN